jgi:hypothetical protein
MSNWNIHRSLAQIFFVALIMLIVLLGCTRTGIPPLDTALAITPTPITPSVTPSPTCPPGVALEGDQIKITRTYLVFLVDPNSTNGRTLEYLDGQYTEDVYEFVQNTLPNILGVGSHYSVFRMGVRTYAAAKIGRNTSKISSAPDIFPTPAPPLTLTPVSTLLPANANTPVLNSQQERIRATQTVASQYATSTQMAREYDCRKKLYQDQYGATATEWVAIQETEKVNVAVQIQGDLESFRTQMPNLETPLANGIVYEGLSNVTIDFNNECSKYNRCILVIIDDLDDWRNKENYHEIPNYNFDLKNVEVISVMPNCKDIIDPSCRLAQALWAKDLYFFGATSVLYCSGDNLEENLINYVLRNNPDLPDCRSESK